MNETTNLKHRGALAAVLTIIATLVAVTLGAGTAQAAKLGSKLSAAAGDPLDSMAREDRPFTEIRG